MLPLQCPFSVEVINDHKDRRTDSGDRIGDQDSEKFMAPREYKKDPGQPDQADPRHVDGGGDRGVPHSAQRPCGNFNKDK